MQAIERGTLIDGRYRVLAQLGAGGMAVVYCAEDTQLGRRIALKLLHERFAADAQFVERFRREASAAAGLQHPNVVQVFDRGQWDGTYYIAMEYLEGRNLKELVREHGALDPAVAADLVLQVLQAERFAHRRGIVHRDIKPHNVIVDAEGRAKVTDFGIARAGASDMTETGSVMGTAQYLSPEQAQGVPVDARSDLYSTGVVLYELLTGTVPFEAESAVTVALKHVSEPPVPPSHRNPAVPPGLDVVVLRALAKRPEDRYQNADEFIAALQGAPAPVYAESVVVEDPALVLEEEDRRNWGRIAAIAIALIALAALAAGAYAVFTPDKARVPDVVGKRLEAAAQQLERRGFVVESAPIQSDDVPEGRVAGQRPEPGTEADEGSTVQLSVSTGPGEAPVPIVQNMTVDEATAALRDAGFQSEQRREYSDTVRRGRVIETSPPAGASVRRGSTVELVVSRGRERIAVPDVTGQPREAAEQALADAGFDVSTTEEERTDAEPGIVVEQDPAAGTELPKGAGVGLVVAAAPPETPVPDVGGQTEDDARQALDDAGFDVRVRRQTVDDSSQDELVIDQDPDPATPLPAGSTVTIVVARFEPPVLDPDPTPPADPTPDPTVAP